MSLSPIAYADSLRIGTIDFVSPDEIKVLLDIEAPDAVALNTGTPRPFPRINGYVLVPSDQGHLVAQVEWITVERSQYPKRKGMQDFGLVDLPYPLRKMSLNPLGCLIYEGQDGDKDRYEFRRGVEAYPTVGDPVLLPTQSQLRAIVESGLYAKDRETLAYPYVELFRDLAAVVCRPNSTLVTYGYSFGDEHINRVIRDMLTIPSTHLVVISRDDNLGRILPLAEERKSQVSLLVGTQLADLTTLTEYFLPKAAIDRATFRMSELLKQRHGAESSHHGSTKGDGQADAEAKT